MIISPLKNAHKPPQVEAFQYGKLSDRQNTRGNSLSLVETEEGQFDLLEFPGQTQGRIVIFGTNTMTTTGADWPYTASDVLTISGCQITANNKTATVVSVSGKTMTFAASTFTPAVETQGSITDGTDVYQITVDPGHPQTLASQTSFDLTLSNKNMLPMPTQASDFNLVSGATVSYSGGVLVLTSTANYGFVLKYLTLKPNTQYTLSANGYKSASAYGFINIISGHAGSGTGLGSATMATSVSTKSITFTTPASGLVTVRIEAVYETGAGHIVYFNWLQLEKGASATDYVVREGITVTVPLRKASDNSQLTLAGRVLTYKADGSPDTWYGYDQIIKKSDGKWYHRKNGEFHADATTRTDFWYLLGAPVDTELSAADQTALNSAEKSFAGITNIMLSTALGQVHVDQWSKAARR
jgi:hypothetical protein